VPAAPTPVAEEPVVKEYLTTEPAPVEPIAPELPEATFSQPANRVSIPELPSYAAKAIAKEIAPDVNRMRVERAFGKREAESAESTKPNKDEQETIANAKKFAESKGWDWKAVEAKVKEQLGLDDDFLVPDSREAKMLAGLRAADERDAKQRELNEKVSAQEAEAFRIKREKIDAEKATEEAKTKAAEKAVRDEEQKRNDAVKSKLEAEIRAQLKPFAYEKWASLKTKKDKEAFLSEAMVKTGTRNREHLIEILNSPQEPQTGEALPAPETNTNGEEKDDARNGQGRQVLTEPAPPPGDTGGGVSVRDQSKPEMMTPEEADAYEKKYDIEKKDDRDKVARFTADDMDAVDKDLDDNPKGVILDYRGSKGIYYNIVRTGKRAVKYSASEAGAPGNGFYQTPKSISGASKEGLLKWLNGRHEFWNNRGAFQAWDYEEGHEAHVHNAAQDNLPVSAAAVDAYGISLPDGYQKEGDLYVFKPGKPDVREAGFVNTEELAAQETDRSSLKAVQETAEENAAALAAEGKVKIKAFKKKKGKWVMGTSTVEATQAERDKQSAIIAAAKSLLDCMNK